MCNKLHSVSAQCTSNRVYQLFDDYSGSDSLECSFIESVRFGTYNEKGEIYIDSAQFGDSVKTEVTGAQKFGIVTSLAIVVVLAVYSCYLHHSITNLLIKSLSHSHLLPPSRHRSRSKGGSVRRRGGSGGSVRGRVRGDDGGDWDRTAGAPA